MTKRFDSSLAGIFFALMGFGLFATHDAIIKSLGGSVAVVQIMFFSTLFSFPWVSTLVLSDKSHGNFRPHHPWMLVARTLSGLMAGGCAFFAFMRLPFAEVYGLLFTTPLLITLLSVPILGERLGVARIAAVLLGFAGVLVMLPIGGAGFDIGHGAALTSALFSSLNALLTRKIGADERGVVMILMPMVLSLFILGVLVQFNFSDVSLPILNNFMAIGTLGFFAQLCIVSAYKRSDAAVIAPMQYSQLIWAIVYGSIFFAENVSTRQIVGASIIVASGLIILYRERKGPNSENKPTSSFRNFRPGIVRNLSFGEKS